MKILRIFSVVVGLHVCALVLIFANPGCSSPNKPAPSSSDTVSQNDEPSDVVSRASSNDISPVVIAGGESPVSSVPSSFDPNATASPEIRFAPTRPGTPAASMLETPPVGNVRPATTYTVTKGDSLWTIAKKHDVSIAEIAAANNIRRNAVIRLGQKLIIPEKAAGAAPSPVESKTSFDASLNPAPAASSGAEPQVKHVVRSGETLGAIARKYQVKVGEIATANNIADPAKIRPGQELIIPGWQAPKGRAPTPAPVERAPVEQAPAVEPSTPSLVTPAPRSTTSNEPPVIRVEENP